MSPQTNSTVNSVMQGTDQSNKESISLFLDKIAVAQANNEEWVETSPEIIKHFNRNGLGGSEYFVYQGIKVCEYGQSEKIEKDMDTPIGNKLFGPNEGTIIR